MARKDALEQELVDVGFRIGAAVAQDRHRVVAVGGFDERVQHDAAGGDPARATSVIPRARRMASRSVPAKALPRRLTSTASLGSGAMSGWTAVADDDSWKRSSWSYI